MNQKNRDLPAMPLMPFKNDFGQMIFLTGFNKQEAVALEIFKTQLQKDHALEFLNAEDEKFLISESFRIAADFCDYLENKGQKESENIIMPV